jgi:hypothetical protein
MSRRTTISPRASTLVHGIGRCGKEWATAIPADLEPWFDARGERAALRDSLERDDVLLDHYGLTRSLLKERLRRLNSGCGAGNHGQPPPERA